ncbi:restriction endonuclease [Tardiphaga sp. vice304]|nr:restriction endonuclease [Tardiphaga sp. vice304]
MPTPWPSANARLLGMGLGLPVQPLVRLAQFSAAEFERFTLEWASDYLAKNVPEICEVQQRGGSGDKGRDVIAWHDPSSVSPRRWSMYQCKHYDARLGGGVAAAEIAKILYYTHIGDYSAPHEYYFVTHQGVTSPLQDLLDDPDKLRDFVITNWDQYCADKIHKGNVPLDAALNTHVAQFDFSIFRAKQPQQILNEHAKTRYHLTVFGLPLIDRPKPPAPPSAVAPAEAGYVKQLYDTIGENIGASVSSSSDFQHIAPHKNLFERSRITFYCAEGLKELARDQMADAAFFDTLLDEFADGLYHSYNALGLTGLQRLAATVQAAQSLQLGSHVLEPHVRANDREGMCHQMANDDRLRWCAP